MRRAVFGVVLCGIASIALAQMASAATVAGHTVGSFSVSSTGAATYQIPLWTPPGPRGIQPHLGLVYNSQTGNGYLGVGWALSGLSSIYRCNETYAQDGAPAAVALTSSDALCIDGQRLLLTTGTYGADGSTYQTEVANFQLVTAHGAAGNGPAYFEVQAPNGTQYFYGDTGDSQVLATGTPTASSWLLNEVIDPAGNTMTIAYCPIGTTGGTNCPSSALAGATVPSSISWTPVGHNSSTYAYTAVFNYGSNAESPTGFQAGTLVNNPYLMGSIQIEYAGATVKDYFLDYQASSTTSRELLQSVVECADSSEDTCLSQTQFHYLMPSPGLSTSAVTLPNSNTATFYDSYDFNGDGINDATWYSASTGTWWVAFGGPGGYGTPFDTGLALSASGAVIDSVDGSGQDEFLWPAGGVFYYYKWNGSSFVGTSTGVSTSDMSYGQFALADVNGDGLPDLISASSDGYYQLQLNTTASGAVSFSPSPINTEISTDRTSVSANSSGARRLDFTGSGQQDFLVITHPTLRSIGIDIEHYTGSGFVSYGGYSNNLVDFADYNDDGCTDALTQSSLILSPCNGSTAQAVSLPGTAVAGLDWDGDGRRDVLVGSGSTVSVYRSVGNGISSSAINTTIPYAVGNTYAAAPNAAGDGLDGLMVDNGSLQYYARYISGEQPDLLSSVNDGYGNGVTLSYVSIARSVNSVYFQTNDATYPYQNYLGPLYVVNQATLSDPSSASNGTYQKSYYYSGAWTNLQGRRFAGFANVQTADARNNLRTTLIYGRAFPYTGAYQGYLKTQNNSSNFELGGETDTLVNDIISDSGYPNRYFVHPSTITSDAYELGSGSNRLVTTRSETVSYDSYGNLQSSSSTLTDEDSQSPNYGQSWTTTVQNSPDVDTNQDADLQAWCLNLNDNQVVTYSSSLSGTNTVKRTTQFVPDTTPSNCRIVKTIVEPSSSQYEVTSALGFDNFGNVNSDTVTGINMSPSRVTNINWGSTGQFPVSIQDPSGNSTTIGYDYSTGLRTSVTDPNNLIESWSYDSFQRTAQVTQADGTYTSIGYSDCDGNCLIGNHGTIASYIHHGSSGTAINSGAIYSDAADRVLATETPQLATGTYTRNEVRYNPLGLVVEIAKPCTWVSLTTTCSDWENRTYDALSRVLSVQEPNVAMPTTYGYNGRTTTVTDPLGKTKTTISDVNGWTRQITDAVGYSITFSYDGAGSQTSAVDNDGVTLSTRTWDYGLRPFNTAVNDADRGSWSYIYDALGERVQWTDAKNQTFTAAYDVLSRMTDRWEPDLYSHWVWGTSQSAHEIGKLNSTCTGLGTNPMSCTSDGYAESETYDVAGRRATRVIQIPADGTYTYTWQWDQDSGLLNSLTYPGSGGLKVQYGYQNGLLQSITDISDPTHVTLWTANLTNPRGQLTEETLGNGVVVDHTFDPDTALVQSITAGLGGGTALQNNSYLWNDDSILTQRQENNQGITENFNYDDAWRLLSWSLASGGAPQSMTYAANGNRTTYNFWFDDGVPGTEDYTTQQPGCSYYQNSQPHAERGEVFGPGYYTNSFCYDANGNNTLEEWTPGGGNVWEMTWTSYNQLQQLTDYTYSPNETRNFYYDENHQRWKQVFNDGSQTFTTTYIGRGLEEYATASGTTYRYFVPAGNNQIVYSKAASGATTYYLTTDHLGSVATVTDSSGNLIASENFDAFGDPRGPDWVAADFTDAQQTAIDSVADRSWTFQEMLPDQGSYDFNGRIYGEGTFMSADPHVTEPANPQNYNRYSYGLNSPLTFTDPTGFDIQICVPNNIEPSYTTGGDNETCTSEPFDPYELGPDGAPVPSPYPIAPTCASDPSCSGPPSPPIITTNPFSPGTPQSGSPALGGGGSGGGGWSLGSGSGSNHPPTTPSSQAPQTTPHSTPCNVGNVMEDVAGMADSLGQATEVGGAFAAAVGIATAGPEGAAPGAAMMAVGGFTTLGGAAVQVSGGILQLGSDWSTGIQNIEAGAASLVVGAVSFMAPGAFSASGSNYVARAFNENLNNGLAFAGAGADVLSSALPGMSPQQATCP